MIDLLALDRWSSQGTSWLHRASAPAKLGAVLICIMFLIVSRDPLGLALLGAALGAALISSRLPLIPLLGLAIAPVTMSALFALTRLGGTWESAIVIVDLGLPDMDGLEVIRRIREWTAVPVIVLSARGQERDKVTALDGGADDYLSKPFSAGELLARIRVALRHTAGASHESDETTFKVGALRVDQLHRRVNVGEKEIRLTPIEYKLLTTLVHHAGKVVTHQQLLREVWGPAHAKETHYLRVYLAQLRRKLEEDPSHPVHLLTEAGMGYRFQE